MNDLIFYKAYEAPFEICGLYGNAKENGFVRLPEEVARATSDGVYAHYKHTSGGRIRFKTDSDVIVMRITGRCDRMWHTTPAMQSGADLYVDRNGTSTYIGIIKPDFKDTCAAEIAMPKGENEVTIFLPLYGEVTDFEIGLRRGASLSEHSAYKNKLPILFYGSSITHGACASRPGVAYTSLISRKYNVDYTCLGFSGACRAEDPIVDYMSALPMSAFVSDYDHNAPDPEYLRRTHYSLYENIRAKNPDIPYFMITRPDFYFNDDCQERRAIVMESYVKAWNSGDKNVYFIDGSAFFNGYPDGELTLDLVHPNDVGFEKMANYIGDVIAKVMKF